MRATENTKNAKNKKYSNLKCLKYFLSIVYEVYQELWLFSQVLIVPIRLRVSRLMLRVLRQKGLEGLRLLMGDYRPLVLASLRQLILLLVWTLDHLYSLALVYL